MQLRETGLGERVDGQRGDELLIGGGIDLATPREILEQLVAVGDTLSPQHGLHGLAEHLPGVLEIGGDAHGIGLDLAEAALQSAQRDQGVTQCDAEVAQHGRVREVALPARDGKLVGKVPQQRIGDTEVTLGIFKVDRVDLVRHRGGADFARDRPLTQVAKADVPPCVTRKIHEDDVRCGECVAVLADPVVRLDLGRERVIGQLHGLYELAREGRPIRGRQGRCVCIEVADGTVPLAEDRDRRPTRPRALQPRGDVGEFLAERGGTCGLSVGAREHRQLRVLAGKRLQRRNDGIELLAEHLACAAQHARVGEVVDVLGRAAKVHELEGGGAGARGGELIAHVVLDRLDVVIGARLDRLDRGRGTRRGLFGERLGDRQHGGSEGLHSGEPGGSRAGERQQPFRFDPHPLADQRRFA